MCLACVLSTAAALPPTEAGRGWSKLMTLASLLHCLMPFPLSLSCLDEGALQLHARQSLVYPSPEGLASQGCSDLSYWFGGCCSGLEQGLHTMAVCFLQEPFRHCCAGPWTRQQQDTCTAMHHLLHVISTKAHAGWASTSCTQVQQSPTHISLSSDFTVLFFPAQY